MTTLILANAWWPAEHVDLYFGLLGAGMGGLAVMLVLLQLKRRLSLGSLIKIMVLLTLAFAVMLGVGIVAWLIDQPPHVWRSLVLFGGVGIGVLGGICVPRILWIRRSAEARVLDAKLLRNE